jgi:hypothetical protein
VKSKILNMKKIIACLLLTASVAVVSAQTPQTTTETKQKATTHTEHKKTTTTKESATPTVEVNVSKKTKHSDNGAQKGTTEKKTKTTTTTTTNP